MADLKLVEDGKEAWAELIAGRTFKTNTDRLYFPGAHTLPY